MQFFLFLPQTMILFCTGCQIWIGSSLFNIRTCKFFLGDGIMGVKLVQPLTSPPAELTGPSVSGCQFLVIPSFSFIPLRWTFFVLFSWGSISSSFCWHHLMSVCLYWTWGIFYGASSTTLKFRMICSFLLFFAHSFSRHVHDKNETFQAWLDAVAA